jgi:hypothetical protein
MSEQIGWPRGQRMQVAVVGQDMEPHWRQALEEYWLAEPLRMPIPGHPVTAAQVNQAVEWWNARADKLSPAGSPDNFAWPKVPVQLRPLFIQVLDIVAEEMRSPSRRATIAENVIRNAIRHAFEAFGDVR